MSGRSRCCAGVNQSRAQARARPLKKVKVPTHQVIAVAGEPVYLPCDISTTDYGDAVLLVLWYREDLGTPIYSVDARERDFAIAERWSDEGVFANRAYFMPERRPAQLGVDRARETDQGLYRCRVDFKIAQTRNSKVNLTVIVPPQKIILSDETGAEKTSVVGPFLEGSRLVLRCDVFGGKPIPWVKWFRNEEELEAKIEDDPESEKGATSNAGSRVRSTIELNDLGRKDVHSELTCQAGNNNRSAPLSNTVHVDMHFGPLNVHILGANQPLSAGRRYDLLCQSSGSRPPASITWWKNGQRLDKSKETTSTDGNTTTSTVSIYATQDDAGKYLACKAENPVLNTEPIEDGWRLDIQYIPETKVRLGTNLNPENIKEGSDVYFDCIIRAHPYVYKVEWRHNGRPLNHNVGLGIIVSNQSLVLQGVGRRTAGNYTCVGFNTEGDGESQPFHLNVMFAPTCKPNQVRVHGVAKQEKAQIMCQVDANPPEVQFRWTFNNSAESMEVSTTHIARSGTSSIVSYTPMTELDYGTLLCWATNRIGHQRVPCVYHIIAAGRPDQVHNCSILNVSMSSFTIRCAEGFNGGLPQTFLLEVRETNSQAMKVNLSSAVPRFAASGLEPGHHYLAGVFAYNPKGRSEPVVMQASTLRLPEKQLTAEKGIDLPHTAFKFTPMMSVVTGAAGAIVIVALIIIILLRNQCNKDRRRRGGKSGTRSPPLGAEGGSTGSDSGGGSPGGKAVTVAALPQGQCKGGRAPLPAHRHHLLQPADGAADVDERNPDIIPDQIDGDIQIDYIRKRQHVSTIETGSPSRAGLLQAGGAGAPGGPNRLAAPYCTAPRNGLPLPGMHDAHHQGMPNNVKTMPAPLAYSTLPRGGHWPSYGGTIAGVRPMALPHAAIPLQHMRTLPRGYCASPRVQAHEEAIRANHQGYHAGGDPAGSPSHISDEDLTAATPETPLMIRDKRESTV